MPDNIVLKGNLTFISLADVFQLLGRNNSSGVLSLSSEHIPDKGLIYFMNGNPINSTYGSLKGIESINAMFGWTGGKFEFSEQKVQIKAVIKKSQMEIVLDALRLLDDGQIERIGPPAIDDANTKSGKGEEREIDMPIIKGGLVDYSYVASEESYSEGTMIVKEKGHGKWISVIYEGTAMVKRDTKNGPLDVARLGKGAFIGRFKALLFEDYQRSAYVSAESDVQLYTLNDKMISDEYDFLTPKFRNLLIGLDERLTKITDRAVMVFEKESFGDEFSKGKKVIIKKGSSEKDLYVIKEGKAYIVGHGPKGNLPLLVLEKGSVIGRYPFLDFGHEPLSATVLASEDLKVEKLDTESLQEEYDRLSDILRYLIYHFSNCISLTTNLVYKLHAGRKRSS